MKKILIFTVLVVALVLTACGATAPASAPTEPAAIAQSFWDAIIAKDMDAAMAFLADDVNLLGGPFYAYDKAKFSEFMSSEEATATFEISDLKAVSADTVTYNMKVISENGFLIDEEADLKIQVKDGKIILLEFAD